MDLYGAVGRRLFLALDPEVAHRLVQRLLGLPLPWALLGGAPRDPRLAVRVAGIDLPNPLGLAAGFDKECAHLDALGRLGFGYVVGGTITRHPRTGNPRPRIARYPRRGSMTNAMGLPNPGAAAAARNLLRTPPTAPRFVSLADEEVEDVVAAHRLLEPLADAVELNASCPNVAWGRDRDDEAHLARVLAALRPAKRAPLFVKLPPFRTERERRAVLAFAGVAREGGADGLTCSNTRPVGDPRLFPGRGGLSGRALFPDTVRIVAAVREAMGPGFPIHACGGVATARDARACLEAGATTVQVYTAFVLDGPGVVGRILRGLLAAGARSAEGADAGAPVRTVAAEAPSVQDVPIPGREGRSGRT
ncbi:MAG TPA: dihydroorotate dehydrogenase 2 [Actinomycetota bacterium]|nr:dihydroorotate dehydrogenase 2 [Actinomycetota bacterium]